MRMWRPPPHQKQRPRTQRLVPAEGPGGTAALQPIRQIAERPGEIPRPTGRMEQMDLSRHEQRHVVQRLPRIASPLDSRRCGLQTSGDVRTMMMRGQCRQHPRQRRATLHGQRQRPQQGGGIEPRPPTGQPGKREVLPAPTVGHRGCHARDQHGQQDWDRQKRPPHEEVRSRDDHSRDDRNLHLEVVQNLAVLRNDVVEAKAGDPRQQQYQHPQIHHDPGDRGVTTGIGRIAAGALRRRPE